MKILHVTNWYPTSDRPYEAIWIKRHVECLNPYIKGYHVLHLEVKPSSRFLLHRYDNAMHTQRILEIPSRRWFVIEIVSAMLLVRYLWKLKYRRFDVLLAHIAYPNLSYWGTVNKFIKIPIVISEHWSAYHFNFNVRNGEKLYRIKRIFSQGIPVIAISKALSDDIVNFSGTSSFRRHILPNVIDTTVFHFQNISRRKPPIFFMLSQWKWPKDPFTVIRAFGAYEKTRGGVLLRIGGYGDQVKQMEELVDELGIRHAVEFLGGLSSDQIAREMNEAEAFLHASLYETFSVVCAEALCCGTPLLASSVGGIKELVTDGSGVLLESNSVNAWTRGLELICESEFDRKAISMEAGSKFNVRAVGEKSFQILTDEVKHSMNNSS